MRVAVLLPSLANNGSIIVARDVVEYIPKFFPGEFAFKVFYFDDKKELDFSCETERISASEPRDFAGFDVVHSHGYRSDKFLSRFAKNIKPVRMSTVHCNVYEDLRYSYGFLISKFFGRRWLQYLATLEQVVVLTKTHELFYSKYINPSRVKVIGNGRPLESSVLSKKDLSFFDQIRKQFPGYSLIGSVSVLNKRKGISQIICTLKSLPEHLLIIIGDGELREKLNELAKKEGVAERCFFLGNRSQAHRFMPFFDVFVLPSYSEAFPLALIEASLHGVSSVCSRIPVLQEIFDDSQVSFFDLENLIQLKDAIELATQEKLIRGSLAKEWIEKEFSFDRMLERYRACYLQAGSAK